MIELNIEFQEQYKRLDKLCRDMYSCGEGVSAYIQDMENTPYNERCVIYNWDSIYKELKHARWMRNQLAHDIPIDSDFCTQADIDWVKNFYQNILTGNDPIACAYRAKQNNAKQNKQQTPPPQQTISTTESKPDKSLWHRIVSKIKSWFS